LRSASGNARVEIPVEALPEDNDEDRVARKARIGF
jgi:hypothetical protein